jgi:hypothetical protein
MSTLKTITDFKSKLSGGGARPNLFEVEMSFPDDLGITWDQNRQEKFQFLCKTATLPASNIAPIDVPFRGRILKVAGDRTFDTWSVTVINDEDFQLRTAFEQWMNGISKLDNNTGATRPLSYMANAVVNQLGRGASKGANSTIQSSDTTIKPLRTYYFDGIFPTSVSQIDLSYDSTDTIEEFTVEFQVQYWFAGKNSETGSGSDQTNTVII